MTKGRIIFTGNFFDYCFKAILLFILGAFTLGIAWIYLAYWSVKYFVAHLEIELY